MSSLDSQVHVNETQFTLAIGVVVSYDIQLMRYADDFDLYYEMQNIFMFSSFLFVLTVQISYKYRTNTKYM